MDFYLIIILFSGIAFVTFATARNNFEPARENLNWWKNSRKSCNLSRRSREVDSYFALSNLITDPDTGILQPSSKFLDENGALFPVIFNLAENAKITANATCGLDRPEVYCKLVEHVLMKPPQCGICEANSSDPAQRHPIENAIDGSPRWWQSPTVASGNKYEYVTITIDMRQSYQVAYVILKAANSPRPAAWELSRSLDGVVYRPWQFFARTDEECMDLFGLGGTQGRARFSADDQVICSTEYSKIHPLEDGEIQTSLINDRPGNHGPSQKLVDFTTARFIRIRLVKLHTLTSDIRKLLSSARLHDSSETRRYFYSIKDISVGGQCICFGHARDCPLDDEGIARCQCSHNTCGDSCEKCCPLFNQRLWKAGTGIEPAVCEGCQCHGHADECYYDEDIAVAGTSLSSSGKYEGGGVCVDCAHNTTGINCERCKPGFFRPLGVDKFNQMGCLLCECEDVGPGSTGQCVVDEESMFGDLQPGDCICHPGFAGPRCDRCAPGFRNYPTCDPCPCNFAGSKNGAACEGDCRCKDYVEGERCDHCKSGFFNLDADNPQGCSPCFCFGVTDSCESARWNVSKTTTLDGWILTDSTGSRILYPSYINGTPSAATDVDTYELDVFYWLAPKEFIGNKLRCYGGKLDYSISFIKGRGDLTGSYTADVDIILEGNGIRIGRGERFFRESTPHHLSIHLQPQGWHHVSLNGIFGDHVSKERFMTLLANLEKLMIRGTYHTRQLESRLLMVSLSYADEASEYLAPLMSVEKCECPAGYDGLSCETCAPGHRRINQTLYNGVCVPCDCHAHATTCDSFTGECKDCQHNAAGFYCEKCAAGHYGDARSGDPNACQPCGCPLLSATNNFSPACISGSNLNLPDDYICVDCPAGYMGAKCESCSDGFFGNPLVPGNFCQPCSCSGNIDLAAIGNCERISGKCLRCIGNTYGFSCENCKTGFFGSALRHNCEACQCNAFGSEHNECDSNSGQCVCKPGYEGRKCERCARGFGQISQGCLPCNCNFTGSSNGECDPITGQCQCLPGVFGLHCRRCQEGFYGFSATGCRECSCETIGSLNQTCRETDGQCFCKPNVIGRSCDRCQDVHWGIETVEGCQSCGCNLIGSMSPACDSLTGQCKCKPGVTGRTCDQCQVGFYGLSSRGCSKCPVCKALGQVCDRETGECVCPTRTTGDRCDKCTPNSYAYHPMIGCKACDCNVEGSIASECDVVTGECVCKEGFIGAKCDQCHLGYFNFPVCLSCRCNRNGTDPGSCQEGNCKCEKNSGQCVCKKNVEGQDCSQCKEHSFTLDHENPEGCFSCFCSGRSDRCWQSSFIWKISAHQGHQVNITYSNPRSRPHYQLNRTLAMDVISFDSDQMFLPLRMHETPLYWNLPSQFLGDRILSYNGKLRLKLDAEFFGEAPRSRSGPLPLYAFPLALLQGNSRLILDYKPHVNPVKDVHEIHFHESKWQNRQSPQLPVTRNLMMVALQNVQHLLVRAHTQPWPKFLQIKDVQLENAGKVPSDKFKGQTAFGVEMCACPAAYNGSSCQNPASGYYRTFASDFLDSPNPLNLLGEAKPCQCHNFSRHCELESGRCISCQQNTAGDQCERCGSGYYGDPKKKVPCRRCACPTLEHNYSEKCAVIRFQHPGNDSYVCTGCPHGFSGDKCQECEKGFFGNPFAGIPCQSCHCNEWGSEQRLCHPVTGQCSCRGGMLGRDCSRCQPGHVISSMGCINCMHDQCIKDLFDHTDQLNSVLNGSNTTGLHMAAVTRLSRLEQRYGQLNIMVQSAVGESASFMDNIFPSLESQFDFDREIRRVMLAANKSASDAISLRQMGLQKQKLIEQTCADVPLTDERIRELVKNLRTYVSSEASQGSLNVQLILTEAERIFSDIDGKTAFFSNSSAIGELSAITAILSEIESLESGGELVSSIQSRYRELKAKLEEMGRYAEKDIDMALKNNKRIAEQTRQRLKSTQDKLRAAENLHEDASRSLQLQETLLTTAAQEYKNASRNFEDAGTTMQSFRDYIVELENTSGILETLNPDYRENWLMPAQAHSLDLARKAEMLAGLFLSAKSGAEDPLKAAHAYDRIVNAVTEARNQTNAAQVMLDGIKEIISPSMDDPLSVRAKEAINESLRMEFEAQKSLDDDVFNLKEILDEEMGRLAGVNATNQRTAQESDRITDRLDHLLTYGELSDSIPLLTDRISAISGKAGVSALALDDILNDFQSDIKPRFDKIKELGSGTLDQTERLVQESGREVSNLNRSIADLEVMSRGLDDVRKDMATGIQKLRNAILAAKQAASSLQVSLSTNSQGICRRSYEPPIVPSSANNILLTYSTTAPERSALLMYIGNPRSYALEPDFMAVEIVGRRVRFIWNVGEDTKIIQHPDLSAKPDDGGFIQANTWYRIEIHRVKNLAQLRVTPMSEASRTDQAASISGSSDASFTRMDLNRSSEMFVGGLPHNVDIPEIKARDFFGCLGQIAIDGQRIGLWNYKTSEGCSGCATGASEVSGGDETSFRFNGNGYASAPQIKRYNNKRYTVALTFRTFDENALLFLCASEKEKNGDFISLELHDGKVVFQFYLGGQNHLLVSTNRRFNTGSFINVRAERDGFLADLRVEDDHIKASLPANKPDGLELASQTLYLGGVPPGFLFNSKYNITYKPLLGCLKDVQIDITAFDLLSKNVYLANVEQGCAARTVRDVSFSKSAGYLRLPGRALPANGSVTFSFATAEVDGLLLASISNNYKSDQHYWTASLQSGRLVFLFNNGNSGVKLQVDKYYDDRMIHTVSIRKRKKRIEITVDDVYIDGLRLSGPSPSILSDLIYVGGAPSNVDLSAIAASARSFKGCISELIINKDLVGFEQLQTFEHASVGRCEFDMASPTMEPTGSALPQALALSKSRSLRQCSPSAKLKKVPTKWMAANFGANLDSDSRVHLVPSRQDMKLFNLTTSFRTFHSSGIIFYAENPAGEEVVLLSLKYGQLTLTTIEDYPQEAKSQIKFDDGQWHRLRLERKYRRFIFQVDGYPEEYIKVSKKFHLADPFYIAGLPESIKQPAGIDRFGFKGCLANVTMNTRPVDLMLEKTIKGVSPCYVNVEQAMYFEGNGYATYDEQFQPDGKLQLEIEFRTGSSNGELVLVYNPVLRSFVQIKFVDNEVVFNVSSGGGSFHVSRVLPSDLCDGQWHRIKALFMREVIMLDVDDTKQELSYAPTPQLGTIPGGPLYIGGRPASIPPSNVPKVPNFVGCLRQLIINGIMVDFTKLAAINNVLLNSCPTWD